MRRSQAEDFIAHSAAFHLPLYAGGVIEHSAEKQSGTTQPLTLMHQRHKTGMDIPLQKNQSAFSTQSFILKSAAAETLIIWQLCRVPFAKDLLR